MPTNTSILRSIVLFLGIIAIIAGCSLFVDYYNETNEWYINNPGKIMRAGNIMTVKAGSSEWFLFNAANENGDPDILSKIFISDFMHFNPDISLADDKIIVFADMSLYILNFSDCENPVETSSFLMPGYICNSCINGDTVFVSLSNDGIYVLESDSLGNLSIIDWDKYYNNAEKMLYYNGHLIFSDIMGNINIVRYGISGFENIYQIHSSSIIDISDFIIDDDIIYIASRSKGIRIIDITDKSSPFEYSVTVPYRIGGLFIDKKPGEDTVVLGSINNINKYSIDEDMGLHFISNYTTEDTITGLCLGPRYLYVSQYNLNSVKVLE